MDARRQKARFQVLARIMLLLIGAMTLIGAAPASFADVQAERRALHAGPAVEVTVVRLSGKSRLNGPLDAEVRRAAPDGSSSGGYTVAVGSLTAVAVGDRLDILVDPVTRRGFLPGDVDVATGLEFFAFSVVFGLTFVGYAAWSLAGSARKGRRHGAPGPSGSG